MRCVATIYSNHRIGTVTECEYVNLTRKMRYCVSEGELTLRFRICHSQFDEIKNASDPWKPMAWSASGEYDSFSNPFPRFMHFNLIIFFRRVSWVGMIFDDPGNEKIIHHNSASNISVQKC